MENCNLSSKTHYPTRAIQTNSQRRDRCEHLTTKDNNEGKYNNLFKARNDNGANTSYSQAPAEGQVGGIVVLWDNNIVYVTEIALTNQKIHCMVQQKKNQIW
nr:uncharacterized protein LOC104112712 isoform X3 [Nicotiana tomentosiformis]